MHGGVVISPFHDIPLVAGPATVYNMVVEIPRGTKAKLEISRPIPLNPIKQDVKKGQLRFIHDPYPFNYGAFPQTWEDPTHVTPETGNKGDTDPLDVCEVGAAQGHVGQVKQVKVLGIWAMIDEGETDWKVLVIDVKDPHAAEINNPADLERFYPGTVEKTFVFLRDYKIPAGSGPNHFGFDNKLLDVQYAYKIIDETHAFWRNLITGAKANKSDSYHIEVHNTTQTHFKVTAEEAKNLAKL